MGSEAYRMVRLPPHLYRRGNCCDVAQRSRDLEAQFIPVCNCSCLFICQHSVFVFAFAFARPQHTGLQHVGSICLSTPSCIHRTSNRVLPVAGI